MAARVVWVRSHPNAERVWIADVDWGREEPVQVVFGGPPIVAVNDVVPFAPPGSLLPNGKKMRRRKYRGEVSNGMFCSLAELGWDPQGPDEVVLLRSDLVPGTSLDHVRWRLVVREPCPRAQLIRMAHARRLLGQAS
ncbi:hypothetical protein Lesp02_18360 [Lentzea sp. NBRC 105346]|nr:hypothetical protein [Lentzea sp. NBRC 105346]GLZ29646.1 hypothetical protein Lesp02_18360 [Lentzea sp. NBRC 105346]